MKKLILIAVVLFLAITGFSQEKKWKKANEANTIESYQKFLSKYPDSEFSSLAKEGIIKLDYEDACERNSISAYEKFLKKHSDSKYHDDVNQRIKQISEEIEARKRRQEAADKKILDDLAMNNSIAAYHEYICKNQNHHLVGQIKQIISEMYSELVDSLKSEGIVKDFSSFPVDKFKAKDIIGGFILSDVSFAAILSGNGVVNNTSKNFYGLKDPEEYIEKLLKDQQQSYNHVNAKFQVVPLELGLVGSYVGSIESSSFPKLTGTIYCKPGSSFKLIIDAEYDVRSYGVIDCIKEEIDWSGFHGIIILEEDGKKVAYKTVK
ncbi:MAG: hypothetical protein K9J84_13590 [Bacteroidia bacterium]|nr:hypothetical protein [Bacteroidia bacterium]